MRLFWLGMHKVLTQTELPRLRQLGYEVFAPPYLSDVVDQSAVVIPPERALSTLPADAFNLLSSYNFYYNSITEEVAELLNAHFDCVIITINPDWLIQFLKVFRGKIIYRVYGQPYPLSSHFASSGALKLIDGRDNFWFVPHLEETAAIEASWLKQHMRIVPYALADDIIPYKDTWRFDDVAGEVGVLCPRIDNAYYAANYTHIKHYFNGPRFPIFGAQVQLVEDKQVVGTIARTALLERFRRLNGFLYHYKDPTVTYLPPIEVMMMGGPVIHFPQSLIGRLFERGAAGAARDEAHALEIAERLMRDDRGLMQDMIASQAGPRAHYDPARVWPKFDEAFRELIEPTGDYQATPYVANVDTFRSRSKVVFIPFHRLSFTIGQVDGRYMSGEGIVRVARMVVRAILERTEYDVVISSRTAHCDNVLGFFQEVATDPRRVRVMLFDEEATPDTGTASVAGWSTPRATRAYRWWRKARKFTMERAISRYMRLGLHRRPGSDTVVIAVYGLWQVASTLGNALGFRLRSAARAFDVSGARERIRERTQHYRALAQQDYRFTTLHRSVDYVPTLNSLSEIDHIFVPHYYFFPETVDIKKRMVLYLPDHMPSIMPPGSFENVIVNNAIGHALSSRAALIMTNSNFSAEYLPRSPLNVPRARIRAFPLPNLNEGHASQSLADADAPLPPDLVARRYDYVFYPTQNRPNKRLVTLAATMAALHRKLRAGPTDARNGAGGRDVALVLSCAHDPNLVALAAPVPVIFVTGVSDATLRRLYREAACLCFTSVAEGNFPTQITEALNYKVPIVATRMRLITTELGQSAEQLILCEPDDTDALADGILHCLKHKDEVLARQDVVRCLIGERGRWEAFAENVAQLFPKPER